MFNDDEDYQIRQLKEKLEKRNIELAAWRSGVIDRALGEIWLRIPGELPCYMSSVEKAIEALERKMPNG